METGQIVLLSLFSLNTFIISIYSIFKFIQHIEGENKRGFYIISMMLSLVFTLMGLISIVQNIQKEVNPPQYEVVEETFYRLKK